MRGKGTGQGWRALGFLVQRGQVTNALSCSRAKVSEWCFLLRMPLLYGFRLGLNKSGILQHGFASSVVGKRDKTLSFVWNKMYLKECDFSQKSSFYLYGTQMSLFKCLLPGNYSW